MTLADLPGLGEVVRHFGLQPSRRLGQNFLLDPGILRRIARAAGDLQGLHVIEVGPGPGGLTRALLEAGAERVIAIERDPRCVAALAELQAAAGDRLQVIEADALEIDAAALAPPPRAIVANLPYNIATPLLLGWLRRATDFVHLTLMFQREVAERLVAAPGSSAYGRLSVAAQWRCRVRLLFDLPPRAFVPPPQVTSTLVRLEPRDEPLAPADPDILERVVAAAFGRRRKMLRSSLRGLGVDSEALLRAAGIAPTERPERLDIEAFCRLARALEASKPAR